MQFIMETGKYLKKVVKRDKKMFCLLLDSLVNLCTSDEALGKHINIPHDVKYSAEKHSMVLNC